MLARLWCALVGMHVRAGYGDARDEFCARCGGVIED